MEQNKRKSTGILVDEWVEVAYESDIPEDSSACVKLNGEQIAIYNFTSMGKWYATQNTCPHRLEKALSRGLMGDAEGEAKIACPFHKKSFSLETGACMSGDEYQLKTYPIKIEEGRVFLQWAE